VVSMPLSISRCPLWGVIPVSWIRLFGWVTVKYIISESRLLKFISSMKSFIVAGPGWCSCSCRIIRL